MTPPIIAIDTNVLVRFLMADDPLQARHARQLVETRRVLVTTTVLLETEWVLRSGYGCPPSSIGHYFQAFLGLPGVELKEPEAVAVALKGYAAGMDFADALHLALADQAAGFASFDRRLISKARKLTQRDLRLPQDWTAAE